MLVQHMFQHIIHAIKGQMKKKIPVFSVTCPSLNLLVKPRRNAFKNA